MDETSIRLYLSEQICAGSMLVIRAARHTVNSVACTIHVHHDRLPAPILVASDDCSAVGSDLDGGCEALLLAVNLTWGWIAACGFF